MEMKFKTLNGKTLFFNMEDGHMAAHQNINSNHIKEAVSKIAYDGTFFFGAVDLEKIIGKTQCIECTADLKVVMKRRKTVRGKPQLL